VRSLLVSPPDSMHLPGSLQWGRFERIFVASIIAFNRQRQAGLAYEHGRSVVLRFRQGLWRRRCPTCKVNRCGVARAEHTVKTPIAITLVGLALALGLVGPSVAASRGAILLGEQQFRCRKGWVAIRGEPRRTIPPGKYEPVWVHAPNGIIHYSCGARPGQIICPIDTTIISIRRGAIGGVFRVECRGVPYSILGGKVPASGGAQPKEAPAGSQ